MQIATADAEEISLFLSDVCVTKSDALFVYRRAVANLTIQNGDGGNPAPADVTRSCVRAPPFQPRARPAAVLRRRMQSAAAVSSSAVSLIYSKSGIAATRSPLSQQQGCQVVEARRASGARDGAPYAESRTVPQAPFQLCVRTPCTSPSRFHFVWLCDDRSKARGNAFMLWPRWMKCHFDWECGWILRRPVEQPASVDRNSRW